MSSDTLPPVPVNFKNLSNKGDDEWKKRLLEGKTVNANGLVWNSGQSDNDEIQPADLPDTEIPDEPKDGVGKEDQTITDMVWNFLGKSIPQDTTDIEEQDEEDEEKIKPKPMARRGRPPKNVVKKPPPKKTPVRRPAAKRKPPVKPKDPQELKKKRLITKYSQYKKSFDLGNDLTLKTTKQLAKLSVHELEIELDLIRSTIHTEASIDMAYDIFAEAVMIGGKIWSKYLKRTKAAAILYGEVDMLYLKPVLDAELDGEDGDPDLHACLKEAAIELAEWLQAPWYYRLGWHAHKIYKAASHAEQVGRHSVIAQQMASEQGKSVLQSVGLT